MTDAAREDAAGQNRGNAEHAGGDASNPMRAANVRETAGEYSRAMQIPLIAGRYLNDGDIQAEWPQAVAVSKSFAKLYFPGRNAIGRRLRIKASRWSRLSVWWAMFATPDVQTMNQYADQAAIHRKFQTVALASFAGAALLLALMGLYGMLFIPLFR